MRSDDQFEHFVDHHAPFRDIIRVENNTDMLQTYLMIDPKGRFFQNRPNAKQSGYLNSSPILKGGAAAAFRNVALSAHGFADRCRASIVRLGRDR